MKLSLAVAAAAACFLASANCAAAQTTYGSMEGAALGQNASLKGAIPFPRASVWNTDISKAPVDPRSNTLIASISLDTTVHPDFGSGLWQGRIIGTPYFVVSGARAKVPIHFTAYGSESDKGPYPIPPNAQITGYRPDGGTIEGDRHLIVLDRDNNRLYELYRAFKRPDGGWNADSGAVFRLDQINYRPTAKPGWTAADAAGMPMFPGLVRYDEASTGVIRHALRFTASRIRKAYVYPANHYAATEENPDLPPMGMRVRLKASYKIPAGFSREAKAIIVALKTYGMFVADAGMNWSISGAPDPRWDSNRLYNEIHQLAGRDFEVVKMGPIVTP
jgi:hypothetical protein